MVIRPEREADHSLLSQYLCYCKAFGHRGTFTINPKKCFVRYRSRRLVAREEMELRLQFFQISALDASGHLHEPVAYPQGQNPHTYSIRNWVGSRSLSGCGGEERNP
jgi:hypothetical protein